MPLKKRSMAAGEIISGPKAEVGDSDADASKMSNYPEVKDSYFSRKSTEWDIIGFLDESKEGSFEQKLDSYIKSLKTIANTEQGKRQEKAQLLIDNYKASDDFFFFSLKC
ncbi:hypothetical protein BC936DRAFT_149855 [Jimgerdemannia flammicorona]|uniref:Uncharacterized protein n=1 Tax=Jimgerdemannia flammicorona TaxID=994334 RepID=A0A433CZY9_9FUNG|nr:hypothetical protein BC936DRAFT_149855 [Jimgerdemannia flammicorona]